MITRFLLIITLAIPSYANSQVIELTVPEKSHIPVSGETPRVGVVLPMSGENSAFGRRVLDAILLALNIPAVEKITTEWPLTFKSVDLDLVVIDSHSDIKRIPPAINLLVNTYKVSAFLGDITAEGSEAIEGASSEFHIPALIYTRSSFERRVDSWSFRVGMSAAQETEALVKAAIDKGAKRFAILYPLHAYGSEMMSTFWQAIEKHRGLVTAVESYERNQTTFTTEIKKMVGKYPLTERAEYQKCMAEIDKTLNTLQKRKALENCGHQVPAIIDFDALFIPDAPQVISYIVPALAAEEIPVSQNHAALSLFRNFTKNPAANAIQLLGTSSWNSPLLATRAAKTIDGALFLDSVNLSNVQLQSHPLIQFFAGKYNSAPSSIEVKVFEAASALREIFSSPSASNDRGVIQKTLASGRRFSGIGGGFSFDSRGNYNGPAYWFTFANGKIETL